MFDQPFDLVSATLPDLGTHLHLQGKDIYVLRRPGLPHITATSLAHLIAYLHTQPLCIYEIEVVMGDIRTKLVETIEAAEALRWREGNMVEMGTCSLTGELVPLSNVVPLRKGQNNNGSKE